MSDEEWPRRGARDVCWFCGGRLIWGNDFALEDVGLEGEGLAIYLHCSDCGAEVEYIVKFGENKDDNAERDA